MEYFKGTITEASQKILGSLKVKWKVNDMGADLSCVTDPAFSICHWLQLAVMVQQTVVRRSVAEIKVVSICSEVQHQHWLSPFFAHH